MSATTRPTDGRPTPAREAARPPRPLMRQSLTLVPPWDPTGAVSIQVIIFAALGTDGETATAADLPELAEAGWIGRSVDDLEVRVRVLG